MNTSTRVTARIQAGLLSFGITATFLLAMAAIAVSAELETENAKQQLILKNQQKAYEEAQIIDLPPEGEEARKRLFQQQQIKQKQLLDQQRNERTTLNLKYKAQNPPLLKSQQRQQAQQFRMQQQKQQLKYRLQQKPLSNR